MKINFTEEEYQQLVTMIEIADWVINAHKDVEQNETNEYEVLRNKILSFADEMGMQGCYEKDGDNYYENLEYEESSKQFEFIEDYDEDSFWEQLVTKLVDRDYEQQYGNEEVVFEVKMQRLTDIEEKYADEINDHGLLNFVVKKHSKVLH
ncbi:MAG: hypothetical protein RQ733_05430 [Methyloprofundus sp.]|nr:hypothetical protein [Methyloprofundus sp.]MDT8425396.1 hypothetical protein [Methyloprofundus sp.]